ncbi:unnamed protein product [Phaedon cochleariae]|uniref:Protein kintoun n=1 Tax=Phaedon cochleariae TaxID=80249 RepID=A0A9P0DG59_PHACE|nr:unnamed protein product [Phaedon cochleariae]
MANSFDKLKELNLSCDEIERIGDALKKPEFRKLLSEYFKEVQDPNNRKLYEEELTELEKERGNDITFIHPKPGYVIKTSVNGSQKAFINISINEHVTKPTSSPAVQHGERGLHWSLPYSLSQPREDFDKNRVPCMVYDVVFHPDTIHLAKNNNAFHDTVNNTALDAIESSFGVILDKKNLKFPKLAYKGVPNASVIRKPSKQKPEHTPEEKAFFDELFAKAPSNIPFPVKKDKKPKQDDKSDYTRPNFVIKQRNYVDMQECVDHKEAKLNSTIPHELIVEIQLPLLKSSKNVKLDVAEKTIQLICESPVKYKLNLTLPYSVNESSGNAEFRKDHKKMVITLPVKRSVQHNVSDSSVRKCEEVSKQFSEVKSPVRIEEFEKLSLIETSEKSIDNSSEFRTKFLDENLHYDIPEFSCHVFNNIIAFTLNVKNVDEKSIDKVVFNDDTSFHVKFTSISSSFYPSHFAFCVKLPSYKINKEDLSVEVWDNNVILQVPVHSTLSPIDKGNKLTSYFYGLNSDSLTEKYVEEPEFINHILQGEQEKYDNPCETQPLESYKESTKRKKESTPKPNRKNQDNPPQSYKEPTERKQENTPKLNKNNPDPVKTDAIEESRITKAINIMGAPSGNSYESSSDELSCSSFSPRKRSILKRMPSQRTSVRRCVSESGLDDYVASSLENCLSSLDSVIPEDGEISCSLKKTVRFNDVVMRQLFRSNSSILGQKKKNQRKAKNKKRCMERRHSESETSGDEKKENSKKGCNDLNLEEGISEMKKEEPHDIFHLEVDN